MRKAFSYARFSTSEQADGYSLARQLQATRAYCERHGLTLDERTFNDAGVSGYHGGNATGGELAAFIELVKDGRIPKGSVLIVENTDRLSRLPPDEATRVICDIVKAGIDIVTTSPEQVYTAANINKLATWLPLQVQQCLAREESDKKADRLRDVWQRKRDELGENKKMSRQAPSWLRLSADRTQWYVVGPKAEAVRLIFRLSLEGLGVSKIAGVMHDKYPDGLKGKGWQPSFIREVLRNRAVIGEFQPHVGTCAKKGGVKKTRRPSGEPVKGYFPAIVEEADFWRVQAALDGRRHGGGRVTGTPNLFNGTLHDAFDGRRMVLSANHGRRVLVSAGAVRKQAGCQYRAVPYAEFETGVLRLLSELTAADVAGKKNGAQAELEAASGLLTALNHKISQAQQRVAGADDPTVFLDLLGQLGRERKEAVQRLEAAKARGADEAGDNLGECLSLVALLAGAEGEERDGLRRRVRAALVRLVESVYVVAVRRGRRTLLVAAQVWFRGGGRRRDYLLRIGPPGDWHAWSLSEVIASGDLDLRRPDHAQALAGRLEAIDLTRLEATESTK
jgi:DNA invertase Pin-like site-specific DNA recombinase